MPGHGWRSRHPWASPLLWALLLACGVGLSCGGEAGSERGEGGLTARSHTDSRARSGPADAQFEMVELLRAGRDAERHPSDGGGRAWLEPRDGDSRHAVAGRPGRFTVVYEAGPLGIAAGGSLHFQVSPFWGWSTPQVEIPEAPGYTLVEPSAADLEIEAQTLDQQLLGIRVTGRPLAEGERIRITYGAGPAGAAVDRYAESDSRFWIAVDGDGDGTRGFLPDSPAVDVLPGRPAQLLVTLPTTVRPGERFRVVVAALDAAGNAGVDLTGEVRFEAVPEGLELPERVALGTGARGVVEGVARREGIYRLAARGPHALAAESNPLVVGGGPHVLWADLHGHSNFSDGTGTPREYFLYARDVAGLDVVALTDHDHWGILPLEMHPERFEEILRETERFHEPGRFVTIPGWEWTSWIHGHRHVLHFDGQAEILSSLDARYESPLQLWKALEGRRALTFAHHSAGGPIATNWEIPPDPRFEPVTEIVSIHGSSEALDSPRVIYRPLPGNFVRDVLDRGHRLGFIGSGDSHDGHPGLAQLASVSGGLAALVARERTREAVFEALHARRVYATNGPRILLRAALGGRPMGSIVPAPGPEEDLELFVQVVAPGPLERLDVIRRGEAVESVALEGLREILLHRPVERLAPGDYLYVRAVQQDGGAAWSSPFFVATAEAPPAG